MKRTMKKTALIAAAAMVSMAGFSVGMTESARADTHSTAKSVDKAPKKAAERVTHEDEQAPGAAAQETLYNEISGGTNSGLTFGSGQDTAFSLVGGYSRLLWQDIIQATIEADLSVVSDLTQIKLRAGPTLNFPLFDNGLRSAIYLAGLIGVALVDATDTSTEFAYKFALGKRFEIASNVFWKPEFNITGTTATGTSALFAIVPAQFSFMF